MCVCVYSFSDLVSWENGLGWREAQGSYGKEGVCVAGRVLSMSARGRSVKVMDFGTTSV